MESYVIVMYYDPKDSIEGAAVVKLQDTPLEVACQSVDPVVFGLPKDFDIVAVIVTPDVDKTQIFMQGEEVLQSEESRIDHEVNFHYHRIGRD